MMQYLEPYRLVTPRRYDLAVKWRYFRYLITGEDEDSERVYIWHIAQRRMSGFVDAEKQNWDDFYEGVRNLLVSMINNGFDPKHAIPIDPDGELLGGAHRVACALALGESVHVRPMHHRAWAPSWGRDWFVEHGMESADLARLDADWKLMQQLYGTDHARRKAV